MELLFREISVAEYQERKDRRRALPPGDRAALDRTLLLAAATNDMDLVVESLTKGANPNARNRDGDTALIVASRNGYTKSSLALLWGWADLGLKNPKNEDAFLAAVDNGHIRTVRLMRRYQRVIAQDMLKAAFQIAARHHKTRPATFAYIKKIRYLALQNAA